MAKRRLVSGWVPASPQISDLDFSELEGLGQVSLSPELRRRISDLATWYAENVSLLHQSPRMSELRPILGSITQSARDLCDQLHRGDSARRAAIDWIREKAILDGRDIDFPALRKALTDLARYADTVIAGMPDDDGREGDPLRGRFILAAHAIFATAGGVGKVSAASQKFVGRLLVLAGGHLPAEPEAFRQNMQRAFRTKQADN